MGLTLVRQLIILFRGNFKMSLAFAKKCPTKHYIFGDLSYFLQNATTVYQNVHFYSDDVNFTPFSGDSCARVNAIFLKRPDSKGHVKGKDTLSCTHHEGESIFYNTL